MPVNIKEIHDISKDENNGADSKHAISPAAAALLVNQTAKDMRFTIRINSVVMHQFSTIAQKLGISNSALANSLIYQCIQNNKNLLDD